MVIIVLRRHNHLIKVKINIRVIKREKRNLIRERFRASIIISLVTLLMNVGQIE